MGGRISKRIKLRTEFVVLKESDREGAREREREKKSVFFVKLNLVWNPKEKKTVH